MAAGDCCHPSLSSPAFLATATFRKRLQGYLQLSWLLMSLGPAPTGCSGARLLCLPAGPGRALAPHQRQVWAPRQSRGWGWLQSQLSWLSRHTVETKELGWIIFHSHIWFLPLWDCTDICSEDVFQGRQHRQLETWREDMAEGAPQPNGHSLHRL